MQLAFVCVCTHICVVNVHGFDLFLSLSSNLCLCNNTIRAFTLCVIMYYIVKYVFFSRYMPQLFSSTQYQNEKKSARYSHISSLFVCTHCRVTTYVCFSLSLSLCVCVCGTTTDKNLLTELIVVISLFFSTVSLSLIFYFYRTEERIFFYFVDQIIIVGKMNG